MSATLFRTIEDRGPTEFSQTNLATVGDLFAQRAALFYTPTSAIPSKFVGQGPIDIRLPIPSPILFETAEIRGYGSPRLWVDLIQRVTGKIRWTPYSRARVRIIRYDQFTYSTVAAIGGVKALLDSLKQKTTGRSDRRLLYYFGAIEDDGPKNLDGFEFEQESVESSSMSGCRIVVEPS